MSVSELILTAIVFSLGAAIGSFLNVVIYRIPAGLSVVSPPSRCPQCLHQLGMGENIPIVGWILLRGKCHHCQTPISARYPLVELATAILFLVVYHHFGISIQTVGYSLLLCWLLALSLIDFDTMTLPNPLTKSGLVVGLVFQIIAGYIDTHSAIGIRDNLINGIFGMVLGIWIYDAIRLFGSLLLGQEAQGGGDAKLMATIGAWLGWKSILLTGFLASAYGTIIMGGASIIGRHKSFQHFPLGPFLCLGATISLFAGDKIIASYQRFNETVDPNTLYIPLLTSLIALFAWLRWIRRRRIKSE